jgi:arylsulfatase A-like enzyme
LPKVKEHFQWKTDGHFGRFLSYLEARGYLGATVFALVSDHGMVGFLNNPWHQLVIEYEQGKEIERLFLPEFGGLAMPLWRGEDIATTTRVVYSPNGGMAHIYVRGQSWTTAPTRMDVRAVAHLLYEEAVGKAQGQIVGDLKDSLGSRPAIFVRTDGNDISFSNDYMWLYKDQGGNFNYGNVSFFLSQRPDAQAWPEFEERLNTELNDKGNRPEGSSRSGDIILVMDVAHGFLTCIHGDEYPGWHGGPTAAEGRVPLIFSFPGGDGSFMDDFVPPDRNWHLTHFLVDILGQTRGGSN